MRLRHGVVALRGAAPDLVAAVLAKGLLTCASAAPTTGCGGFTYPSGCISCVGTGPPPAS